MTRTVLLGTALLLWASRAHAGPFDDLAKKAQPVHDGAALAALFWAQTSSCKHASDDFLRRQCEGVKESRGKAAMGQTYLIRADGPAVSVGKYDKAKAAVAYTVRGCLACSQPVDIGGDKRYVTTRGNTTIQGGQVRGPELQRAQFRVNTDEAARRFTDVVFPRLRVDLLFKIPNKVAPWTEGGAHGYAAELVGVRVADPCEGTVLYSAPAADKLAPDPTLCGGEPPVAEAPKPEKPKEDKPKEPELPARLSPADIQSAMQKARAEANACFATYGVAGDEKVVIEIGGDGLVKGAKLTGDFDDTPTGECILRAVKKTTFPKFKAPSMTINFPFILR